MPPKSSTKLLSKVEDDHTKNADGLSSSSSDDEGEAEESKEKLSLSKGTRSRVFIDRDEYLQAYRELSFDRTQLHIKNNILHRRLAEFYRKRKMEHVLKPLENSQDLEEKYHQKLFSYEELKEKEERECETIRVKLDEVISLYNSQEADAKAKFKVLQDHERNTGTGLIYAKKGKPISDKTVHRFLSLQKSKTEISSAMMLKYIRVRNAVMEQEAIIRNLEKIGPGLYVAQFEQLRIDKLNYTSKIEEREDELIRNRMKCTEHNQILAHIREKMHHTSEVIDQTECILGDAEIDYQWARGELNQTKKRRDQLRIATENERMKAGLITKKMLLRDFQDSVELVEKLRDKKARLEYQVAKYNMELRCARKCLLTRSQTSFSLTTEKVIPT